MERTNRTNGFLGLGMWPPSAIIISGKGSRGLHALGKDITKAKYKTTRIKDSYLRSTDNDNNGILGISPVNVDLVGKVLKKGDYVVYESTVYPGCTEDDCVPILEKESGLKFNKDFFCGYSPERINPSDKIHTLKSITKVTSGGDNESAKWIDNLYKSIISKGTHLTSSIKIAETSKAIENAQRDINIAFINEITMICDSLGIDSHEVIAAAKTKWNFLDFSPGLVGGHCIGVDPYCLLYTSPSPRDRQKSRMPSSA